MTCGGSRSPEWPNCQPTPSSLIRFHIYIWCVLAITASLSQRHPPTWMKTWLTANINLLRKLFLILDDGVMKTLQELSDDFFLSAWTQVQTQKFTEKHFTNKEMQPHACTYLLWMCSVSVCKNGNKQHQKIFMNICFDIFATWILSFCDMIVVLASEIILNLETVCLHYIHLCTFIRVILSGFSGVISW